MPTNAFIDITTTFAVIYIFGAGIYAALLQVKGGRSALLLMIKENKYRKRMRLVIGSIALAAIYVAATMQFYYSTFEADI